MTNDSKNQGFVYNAFDLIQFALKMPHRWDSPLPVDLSAHLMCRSLLHDSHHRSTKPPGDIILGQLVKAPCD